VEREKSSPEGHKGEKSTASKGGRIPSVQRRKNRSKQEKVFLSRGWVGAGTHKWGEGLRRPCLVAKGGNCGSQDSGGNFSRKGGFFLKSPQKEVGSWQKDGDRKANPVGPIIFGAAYFL